MCEHTGKHPRYDKETLAHGALSATTSPDIIRAWWRKWPDANVGIATGPKWRTLVFDIDPRNGGDVTWSELEAELGPLPPTVEAISGGGGRHILVAHPGTDVHGKPGAGIEVLGENQLFVAAPSLHKSGRRYSWELSSEPGMVPVADLPVRWREKISIQSRDRGNRVNRENRVHGDDSVHSAPPPTPKDTADPTDPTDPIACVPGWDEERVIRETLPKKRGQHDECTMRFARGVRLNLGITDPQKALPIFDRWYERARPNVADQDWDECWDKFLRAHETAFLPLGAKNLADAAFQAAKENPPPRCANQAREERARLLISMCWQMHLMVGKRPFKLSCYQVTRLFGARNASTAWKWLRYLERIGILFCEDPGKAGLPGHNAATFRFIGE
jgi:hypothetical protein